MLSDPLQQHQHPVTMADFLAHSFFFSSKKIMTLLSLRQISCYKTDDQDEYYYHHLSHSLRGSRDNLYNHMDDFFFPTNVIFCMTKLFGVIFGN